MRKILLSLFLVSVMIVASVGIVSAESILFPYIANNTANLETLISVINRAPSLALANNVTGLHYRYDTKPVTGVVATDLMSACAEVNFFRPTTANDIVTFSVGTSTQTGAGNAMFETPINPSYFGGGGATSAFGPFNHTQGSPRIGHLMVTHANMTTSQDVERATRMELDGEAALYDLVNGAMWGYRALISNAAAAAATPAATTSGYVFTSSLGTGSENGRDVLVENGVAVANMQPVAIYPPNQFTTRFFVTPLVRVDGLALGVSEDMRVPVADNAQWRTRIRLLDNSGNPGYYDRNENPASAGVAVQVRCVGRVELTDMAGTAWFGVGMPYYAVGGWALADLLAPALVDATLPAGFAATSYNAWVAKLEYGNLTGLTGMINSANVLRDYLLAIPGITGGR